MTKKLLKLQPRLQIYDLTVKLYLFAESREKVIATKTVFEFVAHLQGWPWCFINTKELDKSLHEKALKDLQEIGNIYAVEDFKSLIEKNLPEIFLYEIEYHTHLITNSLKQAKKVASETVKVLKLVGYAYFLVEISDYGCTLDKNPALTKQQVANGILKG